MNSKVAIFILNQICVECKKAHLDSEAEAIEMAIRCIRIVEAVEVDGIVSDSVDCD